MKEISRKGTGNERVNTSLGPAYPRSQGGSLSTLALKQHVTEYATSCRFRLVGCLFACVFFRGILSFTRHSTHLCSLPLDIHLFIVSTMPITKKRGAIFAIYADSPVQPTTSSSTKITQPSSNNKHTSPSKRSSSSRQALASLQPAPRPSLSCTDTTTKSKIDVQNLHPEKGLKAVGNSRQGLGQRSEVSSASTKITRAGTTSTRKTIIKRDFEIYQESPAQQSKAKTTKSTNPLTTTTASSSLAPQAELANPKVSPAKRSRTRSTPSKPTTRAEEEDKENQGAIMDSPASRTRSKTRVHVAGRPGNPLGDVFVDKAESPKPTKRAIGARRLTSISVLADVTDIYGGSGDIPEGFATATR